MSTFKLSEHLQFKEVDKTQFPCSLEIESKVTTDTFRNPGIFFLFYEES